MCSFTVYLNMTDYCKIDEILYYGRFFNWVFCIYRVVAIWCSSGSLVISRSGEVISRNCYNCFAYSLNVTLVHSNRTSSCQMSVDGFFIATYIGWLHWGLAGLRLLLHNACQWNAWLLSDVCCLSTRQQLLGSGRHLVTYSYHSNTVERLVKYWRIF